MQSGIRDIINNHFPTSAKCIIPNGQVYGFYICSFDGFNNVMYREICSDYFKRSTTEGLKGFLALAVLFHHIYQKTQIVAHSALCGFFLQSLGYYCVSLFFFISGYGLLISFNRGGYLRTYQKNRVFPIWVINALLVLAYALQKNLLGMEVTWCNMFLSLSYGGDVVDNGWYLLCIIVFYELFYISAIFFPRQLCQCVFLLMVFYVMVAFFLMPPWWYISSLAFPLGVMFGKYKLILDKIFLNHYPICLMSCAGLYLCCFILLYELNNNDTLFSISHYHTVVLKQLLAFTHGVLACFLVVCILMMERIQLLFKSCLLCRLSNIYLEIYVMQGLAFNFLRNSRWNVQNDFVFATVSIALTMVLSVIIHPVFSRIIALVKTSSMNIK